MVWAHLFAQGNPAQVQGIFSHRYDISIIDFNRLFQQSMAVAGDNQVNAVHRFCQFVVLTLAVLGTAVRQADDKIGAAVGFNFLYDPLGSLVSLAPRSL